MKNYKVIEDIAGGLILVVFAENGNAVEYVHGGYEYNPGQLIEDLLKLRNGDDPVKDWEGNEMDDCYEDTEDFENWFPYYEEGIGWNVVADQDHIYPMVMGAAACREFHVDK